MPKHRRKGPASGLSDKHIKYHTDILLWILKCHYQVDISSYCENIMLSLKFMQFSYWLLVEIIGVLFCYTIYNIIYFYFLPFHFIFGDYLKVFKGSAVDIGFLSQTILQVKMAWNFSPLTFSPVVIYSLTLPTLILWRLPMISIFPSAVSGWCLLF